MYRLCVKNKTYAIICLEAEKEGKSIGLKINEILDEWAEHPTEKKVEKKVCFCGREAIYRAFKDGKTFYFCVYHEPNLLDYDGKGKLAKL